MKIHGWVTAVGITGLLAGCGGSPSPAPPTPPPSPRASAQPAKTKQTQAAAPVILPKVPEGAPLPPIPYEAKGRPDPFRSPVAQVAEKTSPPAPKTPPPMEVKGIVTLPAGFVAIVNEQIVKVGDLVGDHRVERITESEVVLRQPDGSPRSVTLPEIGAVRPVARKR